MFCPHCKAEYRPGFTICADCEVDLVDALPEPESKEPNPLIPRGPLIELLRTRDPAFVAFLKSVFMAEVIPHVVYGEHTMYLPTMHGGTAARFMVAEADFETARKLLNDIETSK